MGFEGLGESEIVVSSEDGCLGVAVEGVVDVNCCFARSRRDFSPSVCELRL